jgi:hypothetical protein
MPRHDRERAPSVHFARLDRVAHAALEALRGDASIHNAAMRVGARRIRRGKPTPSAVLHVVLVAEARRRGLEVPDAEG